MLLPSAAPERAVEVDLRHHLVVIRRGQLALREVASCLRLHAVNLVVARAVGAGRGRRSAHDASDRAEHDAAHSDGYKLSNLHDRRPPEPNFPTDNIGRGWSSLERDLQNAY